MTENGESLPDLIRRMRRRYETIGEEIKGMESTMKYLGTMLDESLREAEAAERMDNGRRKRQ